MWEAGDLLRLGQLRKLAVDTGQPDEALHFLDAAQTADDAMDALAARPSLIPSGEQSAEEVLSWFSPLLEPGCDQLDAEMCAAEFIGSIRQASHREDLVPELLCDLIATAAAQDRAESAVMLRTLAVIGPNESRAAATAAIAARPAADLAGLPWTEELGSPVPGRAFGYTDIYDEQTSLVLTFAYGRKRHAVVVLIDYLLGGGIKDCYVVDYTESLRANYRKVARDPELTFTDYSLPEAASLLFTSLSRPPCPQEPDQVECVQHNLDLLWARADLIIGKALPPAASRRGAQASRRAAQHPPDQGDAARCEAAGLAAIRGPVRHQPDPAARCDPGRIRLAELSPVRLRDPARPLRHPRSRLRRPQRRA